MVGDETIQWLQGEGVAEEDMTGKRQKRQTRQPETRQKEEGIGSDEPTTGLQSEYAAEEDTTEKKTKKTNNTRKKYSLKHIVWGIWVGGIVLSIRSESSLIGQALKERAKRISGIR